MGLSGLSWIGNASFAAAGQVHAVARGGAVQVEVNTSGGGGAEMAIKLEGLTDATLPSSSDFLL